MARAKIVVDNAGAFYGVRFNCPGCSLNPSWRGDGIIVLPVDWTPAGYTRSPHVLGNGWTFNGDLERPTFGPSILTRQGCDPTCDRHEPSDCRPKFACHSFVRDGRIEFLSDCTHALAGQTVDLPEINERAPT